MTVPDSWPTDPVEAADKEPVALYGWRERLLHGLCRVGRVRRIHLLGCRGALLERFHVAVSSLDRCVGVRADIGARGTSADIVWSVLARHFLRPGPVWLVSRSGPGWTSDGELAYLIERVRRERIGLIQLVHDPRPPEHQEDARGTGERRAAMTSWADCMRAASIALEAVRGFAPSLCLRYEDLARDPEAAADRICGAHGLRRPSSEQWAKALEKGRMVSKEGAQVPDAVDTVDDPPGPERAAVDYLGRAETSGRSMGDEAGLRRAARFLREFGYDQVDRT